MKRECFIRAKKVLLITIVLFQKTAVFICNVQQKQGTTYM